MCVLLEMFTGLGRPDKWCKLHRVCGYGMYVCKRHMLRWGREGGGRGGEGDVFEFGANVL